MFYGKPSVNGRDIEFISTDSYKVQGAGNFKFPKSEKIREWLEPRIQAIVNSFQESEAFKSIAEQLGEGSVIGGAVVARLAGEGVSTNKLKNVGKFIAVEACYAIFKPVKGPKVKIYLNSEYLDGFCNGELRIFETPELWWLADPEEQDEELVEVGYQNLMDCEFCKITFGLQGVKGNGVVWYEDKMLDPEIFEYWTTE
mgnify:FL=1